jgi:hypothetical protein
MTAKELATLFFILCCFTVAIFEVVGR